MKLKFLFVFMIIFLSQFFICNILLAEDNSCDRKNKNELSFTEYQGMLSLQYSAINTDINSEDKLFDKDINTRKEEVSEKSPWLAFGLSYLFPGLGQLYNGEYLKAILFPTVFCVGLALIIASNPGADFEGQNISPLLYIGIGIGAGSYLWNLIDAPISANKINDRIKRQTGLKIFSSEDEKYVLRIKSNHLLSTCKLELAINF